MIGRTIGRYRVLEKLGEGGMGSVWRAEDPLLGRTIALKFLADHLVAEEEARQRFLREARSASRLQHPGIATVFDAGEEGDLVFIALHYVDGGTVAARVDRGPLPVDQALNIARQAADALDHAHENGIIHRDVTARNIMLTLDGRAIIVDFGLALPEDSTRITRSGTTMGTVAYIAPEVIEGHPADRRADLYGLGVVLYEMLAGRVPFIGERQQAVLWAAVNTPAEPPSRFRPGLHEGVDAVALRALAKKPADRYQRAAEFSADIQAVIAGQAPPYASGKLDTVPLPDTIEIGPGPPRVPGPPAKADTGRSWAARHRTALIWSSLLAAILAGILVTLPSLLTPTPTYASIAVLPMRNLSADPEASDHYGDGIGETLASKFTQLAGLRVVPWITTQRYTDLSSPLQEIAAEMKVDALMIGTYRVASGRVQGTVALVEGATGQQVWSDDFDQPSSDLFAVQAEIAVGIATRLRGRLSGQEESQLVRPVAASAEAYDFYLRAADAIRRNDIDTAQALFSRALEIDPTLARAHVGIGAVHNDRYFYGLEGGTQSLIEAESRYRRALELQPDLISALRGLVRVTWEGGDPQECLGLSRRIADLGREDSEALLARAEAYTLCGLPDKAVPILDRIVAVDPTNEGAHWFRVIANAWAQNHQAAIDTGEEYFRRFGDDPEVNTWMGYGYHALGDLEEARVLYEVAADQFGERTNYYNLYFLGNLYEDLGEIERSREVYRRGLAIIRKRLDAYPDNDRLRAQQAVFRLLLDDVEGFEEYHARPHPANHVAIVALIRKGRSDRAVRMLREGPNPWSFARLQLNTSAPGFGVEEALESGEIAAYLEEYADFDRQLRADY